MTDPTELSDTTAEIEALSLLVTDEELAVLLAGDPSGLAVVFPDEDITPAPPVASAIRRALVARRALVSSLDDDSLEPVEPWNTLIVLLAGPSPAARITTDGDAARAVAVVVGTDDVLTLERDATGVNVATFTGPGDGAQAIVAPLLDARGESAAVPLNAGSEGTHRITADAFADGRAAIDDGQDDRARELLGDAFALLFAAGTAHRVELLLRASPDHLRGVEFDVLDASDLGWVVCAPCHDAPELVELRQVDDAGLTAFVAALLAA